MNAVGDGKIRPEALGLICPYKSTGSVVRCELVAQKLLTSHSELLRKSLEMFGPEPLLQLWRRRCTAPCGLSFSTSSSALATISELLPLQRKISFLSRLSNIVLYYSALQFLLHYGWEKGTEIQTQEKCDSIQLSREFGVVFALRSAPQLSSLLDRLTTVLISACDKSIVVKGCSQMIMAGIWEYTHI